jgi:hypothetical protein
VGGTVQRRQKNTKQSTTAGTGGNINCCGHGTLDCGVTCRETIAAEGFINRQLGVIVRCSC